MYLVAKIKQCFSYFFLKKENTITDKIPADVYHPLSPTDNAENIEHYSSSLRWALENRKKIKNIGITGPYGSGKSSFLQTFRVKQTDNELHFLNISLATFKEEEEKITNNIELLRLIELSILQQLFYHEQDDIIPDSRFKKIKKSNKKQLFVGSIGIVLFLLSLYKVTNPESISRTLGIQIYPQFTVIFNFLALTIILVGLFFIARKSLQLLKDITIKALTINNASIEIDEGVSKSILNNHIDEILYFFEVTKYNIVIIEDLDRFEQTEIFTKLREINLLINNSKKINKDVVFIYAIRDDMFKDKDRAKFFDFLIPIIPIINSSNSKEKLLALVEKNNYKISDDLLEDLALFINDMRLLYNVMNEYHLYSKMLSPNLSQNKLLSMIVYKNLYPNDFAKLADGKSIINSIMHNKNEYIKELLAKTDGNILENEDKIELLETRKITNIKELRAIYVYKLIENIIVDYGYFGHLAIEHREKKLTELLEDENFLSLRKQHNIQLYVGASVHYPSYNFNNIERSVDIDQTYDERENLVSGSDDNKIERLKKYLEELKNKKNDIKKYKLKDLLTQGMIELSLSEDENQNDLFNILLRSGYIDEDYLDYISIFYEGSLTKIDHQFLINVKTQKNTPFDYKLVKIEKLLEKLNLELFDKSTVLNYSLLDYLLQNDFKGEKIAKIFSQLANESEQSIEFMEGFIDYSVNEATFMNSLCSKWTNIWDYIENNSNYAKEKKNKYYKLIIEHAEFEDLKVIFKNYPISHNKNFLKIGVDNNRITSIIKNLDLQFKDIAEDSPRELLDFIYDGYYYLVNPSMLVVILRHKGIFNEENFTTKNYSAIQTSGLENLIEHIEANFDEYIASVYLKLESNVNEPYVHLIMLLNNPEISEENKELIISHTETVVEDLSEIENTYFYHYLVKLNKAAPTWKNLILTFKDAGKELTSDIISFINIEKNALGLSKEDYLEMNIDDDAVLFMDKLLLENAILDACYSIIMKSISWGYSDLNLENLSEEKAKILIENKILEGTLYNYFMLKNNFEKLHVLLIENHQKIFKKDINSYQLHESSQDILAILKSSKISLDIKEDLLNLYILSIYTTEPTVLAEIGKLLSNHNDLNIREEMLKYVLSESKMTTADKIKIFTKKIFLYANSEIDYFLEKLPEPYSDIAIKGKRPKIDNNQINLKFAQALKENKCISSYKKIKTLTESKIQIVTFNPL